MLLNFAYGFNLADAQNYNNNLKIYDEVKQFADELNAKYIIFHGGVEGSCEEVIRQLNLLNESRAFSQQKDVYDYCNQFNMLKPEMYHLTDSKDITSPYDDHSHLGEGEMNLSIICKMIADNSTITIETKKNFKNSLDDFKQDIVVLKQYCLAV